MMNTMNDLEKFLGAKRNQLQQKKGQIYFSILDPNVSMKVEMLTIHHNGKVVTKLEWEDCYMEGMRSSKTKEFVRKMEKQLGI